MSVLSASEYIHENVLALASTTDILNGYLIHNNKKFKNIVDHRRLYKNFILLILCIKECENFYMSIKEAERQCLLYSDCQGMENLFKNVHRINKAKFNKMTICSFFTMDAALPLRFLDLVATYTIVILQFALTS
ncbi:unnamed protein product [Euphydryas editha]|uniref:Gustatory receptor n=1 Tax=Euphydryas editha TaxID=104508 RepID=A0AAU9UK22_EUPED|nr:unnamed protein product [Euphydryas editha]